MAPASPSAPHGLLLPGPLRQAPRPCWDEALPQLQRSPQHPCDPSSTDCSSLKIAPSSTDCSFLKALIINSILGSSLPSHSSTAVLSEFRRSSEGRSEQAEAAPEGKRMEQLEVGGRRGRFLMWTQPELTLEAQPEWLLSLHRGTPTGSILFMQLGDGTSSEALDFLARVRKKLVKFH